MNSGREWRIIMQQEMTEQGDKERRGQGSWLTVYGSGNRKPEAWRTGRKAPVFTTAI